MEGNTCFKVFSSFHLLKHVILFIFLLLDNIKLSLDSILSLLLLSSCEFFELLSIFKRIPGRCICIQDVLIIQQSRDIFKFHGEISTEIACVIGITPTPRVIQVLFAYGDLWSLKKITNNIKGYFKLKNVLLEFLCKEYSQVIILWVIKIECCKD